MKTLLLLPLLSISTLNTNNLPNEKAMIKHVSAYTIENNNEANGSGSQQEPSYGKMRSVIFKNQEYCRAEMPPDFEFDVKFTIVSATVYFTGANFPTMQKGVISSASLKPLKTMMDKCIPGTFVVFDDVKVKGPDNFIRTIPGISLQLF